MKKLNPTFLSLYRGSWRGMKHWGWGASLFRLAFSGSTTKNLPKNTETLTHIIVDDDKTHSVVLVLKPFVPSTKQGSWGRILHNSNHRVFVKCDCCCNLVPAGRIHQHKC